MFELMDTKKLENEVKRLWIQYDKWEGFPDVQSQVEHEIALINAELQKRVLTNSLWI